LVTGLAAFFGPLLGTIFYEFAGYKGPFFVIGSLYILMIGGFMIMTIAQKKPSENEMD